MKIKICSIKGVTRDYDKAVGTRYWAYVHNGDGWVFAGEYFARDPEIDYNPPPYRLRQHYINSRKTV